MTLADYLTDAPWKTRAACRGVDHRLFFPTERGDSANKTRLARKICEGCPVAVECLDYALENTGHDFGIWAGTNAQQRRKLRKQKARAA